MLQSYKEEVDTLNEALKIAAMDIAEVAEADDDLFDSDGEEAEERDEEGDDADMMSASAGTASVSGQGSGKGARSAKKEEEYRRALRTEPATGAPAGRSTFVIKEDGTFQKK
jgi:hypothetical protein